MKIPKPLSQNFKKLTTAIQRTLERSIVQQGIFVSGLCLGVGLVVYQVGFAVSAAYSYSGLSQNSAPPQVEKATAPDKGFESQPTNNDANLISVNVAGAVLRPGVYRVKAGTLLVEVLEMADGFTPQVDGDFVSQELNLAQALVDHQHVYVPSANQSKVNPVSNDKNSTVATSKNQSSSGVSVNNASAKELMVLDGIGEKRAEDIIGGRPYSTLEELVTSKVLSQSLFDSLATNLTL